MKNELLACLLAGAIGCAEAAAQAPAPTSTTPVSESAERAVTRTRSQPTTVPSAAAADTVAASAPRAVDVPARPPEAALAQPGQGRPGTSVDPSAPAAPAAPSEGTPGPAPPVGQD